VKGSWPLAAGYGLCSVASGGENAVFVRVITRKNGVFPSPESAERLRRRLMANYPSHAAIVPFVVKGVEFV